MNVYENKIALCERIIQYEFTERLWCLKSLHASGQRSVWQNELIVNNNMLAVLGDALVKAHLCERWYGTGRSRGKIMFS